MPKVSVQAIRLLRYGSLIAGGFALVYFIAVASERTEQLDDAFISYRYALNLAQGHGLVYNIGERVEGFTNLLWTLLVALGFWLHDWDGPTITRPLSVVFGASGLLAAWFYARALLPEPRRWIAALVPVIVVTCSDFLLWHTSGLETPLFICLIVASCWASAVARIWAVVLGCIFATLTRPEGALLAGCLIGVPTLHQIFLARRSGLRACATILAPALVYALFLGLLLLGQFAYYGDPLPNTFAAKIGQIGWRRGAWYVGSFLADGSFWLIPGVLGASWLVPRMRPALLFVLLYIAYIVDIGGDVFDGGRFMATVFPILVVANVATAGIAVGSAWATGGLLLPAALCGCFGLFAPFAPWSIDYSFGPPAQPNTWFNLQKRRNNSHHVVPGEDARVAAKLALMRKAVPGLRTIATIGVGRIGYDGMDIRILDLVGLLERHIAHSNIRVKGSMLLPGHSRTDAAYVLARAPDIIDIPVFAGYKLPGSTTPVIPPPKPGVMDFRGVVHLPCVVELWRNPGLPKDYIFSPALDAWVRKTGISS
jgi:hypothetical protein